MLGLAIGDALGAPVSGWPPDRIVERLGVVDRYPDLDRLPGLYTARSQQALAVQDTLLEEGKLDPLGLAARLPDERSRGFVFQTAFNNARELVELIRLHIYREDHVVFPLAQKLISTEELDALMRN